MVQTWTSSGYLKSSIMHENVIFSLQRELERLYFGNEGRRSNFLWKEDPGMAEVKALTRKVPTAQPCEGLKVSYPLPCPLVPYTHLMYFGKAPLSESGWTAGK